MGGDALRPDNDTYKSVYEKAYSTWWVLWKQASTDPELPSACLDLEHIFPQHPYFPVGLDLDPSGLLTATSTWIPTSGCCGMPAFEQRFQVTPSIGKPTTILTTTDSNIPLQKWFGKEDSHLTVLVLAWAYVLSARWTSMISSAAPLEYTTSQAKWAGTHRISKAEGSVIVQLGSVSDEAARWWAAILAPGQGWKASIPHKRYRLLSPWAVFLDATYPILLSSASEPASPALGTCPSFEAAAQYIAEYSALHAASEQNRAAFATALLLPLANFDRRKVRLPLPRMPLDRALGTTSHGPIWGQDLRQFDKLLTLGCNTQGIKSILSSIFYEPDVPCNVCGAWLQGTFALLHSKHTQGVDVLARMFFLRSPHLSFLWLGAIITGAHKNFLRNPRGLLVTDEIDLHEAAWTGTVVSFIQEPVTRLPHDANSIARADEWRLAYLSQGLSEYKFPPLYPYPPPGRTAVEDLDIDVRLHATCPGNHRIRCSKISWNCTGGRREVQEVVDERVIFPEITPLRLLNYLPIEINYDHLDREKDLSEVVTRTVFNWMRGADGFPVAERDIYNHEWLDNFNSDDESIHEGGGGRSTAGSNALVRGWLSKSLATRCNSF
ncbi:hypothetical protein MRS44_018115 [Fusarium solani]|uniref:uncharacterized protein n=1 Tax=Fusarium solani TaxID=169388 RepID=UPI0032C47D5D|nr:hypothetical protein MRS44_018115 [Fusarium solani]